MGLSLFLLSDIIANSFLQLALYVNCCHGCKFPAQKQAMGIGTIDKKLTFGMDGLVLLCKQCAVFRIYKGLC